MEKEKNSGEKRKFTRFEVNIPVGCRPVRLGKKTGGTELVYAMMRNISNNGILLEWQGKHEMPEFLKLGIRILPTSKPIECVAKKVWTKKTKSERGVAERYDVGLSFVKDEHTDVPTLISRRTNLYWQIFERTGCIEAYLLHKEMDEEPEESIEDDEDA